MKTAIAVSLLLACLGWHAPSHAACGTELTPCEHPSQIGTIKTVVVERSWTNTGGDAPIDCAKLPALDAGAVRRYLRQAGRIDQHDALHQVDQSPCRASGTLTTRDGRQADWVIGILREGTLQWRHAQDAIYLYCGACGKPFMR